MFNPYFEQVISIFKEAWKRCSPWATDFNQAQSMKSTNIVPKKLFSKNCEQACLYLRYLTSGLPNIAPENQIKSNLWAISASSVSFSDDVQLFTGKLSTGFRS